MKGVHRARKTHEAGGDRLMRKHATNLAKKILNDDVRPREREREDTIQDQEADNRDTRC